LVLLAGKGSFDLFGWRLTSLKMTGVGEATNDARIHHPKHELTPEDMKSMKDRV